MFNRACFRIPRRIRHHSRGLGIGAVVVVVCAAVVVGPLPLPPLHRILVDNDIRCHRNTSRS